MGPSSCSLVIVIRQSLRICTRQIGPSPLTQLLHNPLRLPARAFPFSLEKQTKHRTMALWPFSSTFTICTFADKPLAMVT